MDILHANHISKSYGDKEILGDIHLRLADGELVSILGVSGVGKTTLFNVLSGLLLPDAGNVELLDENGVFRDISGETGHLSYMLQKDMLLPHKTRSRVPILPNSDWRGRKTNTPRSSPGACGREPRCCGPGCAGTAWPFWTNLSARWIR